jgi:hypothetical protein
VKLQLPRWLRRRTKAPHVPEAVIHREIAGEDIAAFRLTTLGRIEIELAPSGRVLDLWIVEGNLHIELLDDERNRLASYGVRAKN